MNRAGYEGTAVWTLRSLKGGILAYRTMRPVQVLGHSGSTNLVGQWVSWNALGTEQESNSSLECSLATVYPIFLMCDKPCG